MSLKSLFSGALGAGFAFIALGTASITPAHALVLSASDAICTSDASGGNDTDFLAGCGLTGLSLYYKSNNGGVEEGSLTGSYTTTFVAAPGSSATISYDSPNTAIVCPDCYLIAKDGRSTPNWFLFDIGTWNGVDTITIGSLFFRTNPQGQVIEQDYSHVSIWGVESDDPGRVPEPASLALVALAVAGAGMVRSRRK